MNLLSIVVIIISIFYITWSLLSDIKDLRHEINGKDRTIQFLENRYFNIEEVILKKIDYEGMHIPDDLYLKKENGESINIKSIFKNSNKKLLIRISERNCLNCILTFNSILQNEVSNIEENNIIFIVDYDTDKKRNYYKKILNINTNVYISQDIGIPIEKEELPYVFILNNDLSIDHLFIPIYDNNKLSEKYIKVVRKQLRNNI